MRYRLRFGGAMTRCSVITVRSRPRGIRAADGRGSGVRARLMGSALLLTATSVGGRTATQGYG